MTEPEPLSEDDQLLADYAHDAGDDRWYFSSRSVQHSRADALALIRAHVALGTTPADVWTVEIIAAVADRLTSAEARIAVLEAAQPPP